MNRQTKRMLQRQGQLGPDGTPAASKPTQPKPPPVRKERKRPLEFAGDVRGELRKVAWPTRREVANYSFVVLVTLIILITLIFALDWLFAQAVLRLFD